MKNVIWADDDCKGSLRFLGRSMKRRGINLYDFEDYLRAKKYLEKRTAQDLAAASLLVDVILPRSLGGNALDPYLGIDLAETALDLGVPRVCFLTVIPHREVEDGYKKLEQYKESSLLYIDKLSLLDRGKLDEIAKFLTSNDKDGS